MKIAGLRCRKRLDFRVSSHMAGVLRIFVVCLLLVSGISAQAYRVAILDIKNHSGSANFDYLEASITDAIKDRLKSKFAFSAMSRERWLTIAKESFFVFEREYADKSFALGIGLMGQQDLVVGGSFTIDKQKIVTTVHLINVAEKRLIKEITVTGAADARIFTSIETIADRVAEEAQSVLPNKEEWQKSNSAGELRDDEITRFHQLLFWGGISLAKLPSYYTGTLDKTTPLTPNELRKHWNLALDYQRFGLLGASSARGWLLWIAGEFHASTDRFAVPYTTSTAAATGIYGTVIAGAGYRYFFWRNFYATPLAGAFVSVGTLQLDYSDLDVKPRNLVTDKEEALQSLSFFTPGFALDGRIGWDIHRRIAIEAGLGFRLHLYQRYTELLVSAYLGAGYKF